MVRVGLHIFTVRPGNINANTIIFFIFRNVDVIVFFVTVEAFQRITGASHRLAFKIITKILLLIYESKDVEKYAQTPFFSIKSLCRS